MEGDYWEQSTQPFASACFVVPLLVLYEVGIAVLGPEGARNGADLWLRGALAEIGFVGGVFLPLVTCGWLLGLHHLSRRAWRLDSGVLSGMVCESISLGIALLVFAHLWSHAVASVSPVAASLLPPSAFSCSHLLSYLGAGIYEELLFRLWLLSGLIGLARHSGVSWRSAATLAIVASSLLFAAAHYRLFMEVGLEFSWSSFLFRLLAGTFFSILYLQRGFGIVVGTHAVYDVLVVTSY